MIMNVIGILIGALILVGGIYYFCQAKEDKESRKIYGTISGIGGIIFAVTLALAICSGNV